MTVTHIPGDLTEAQEEQRRYLIDQIRLIQREYEKAIEPYRRRLTEIEATRPPGRLILTGDADVDVDELLKDLDARDKARGYGGRASE